MPFVIEEQQFVRKRGSRREVLDGLCYCTSGGLVADQLEDRNGKIISKRRSAMGKERYASKNPFKNDETEPDEKTAEVQPKKRKRVTIETIVPIRVPVARRKRTRARRGKK